MQNTRNNYKTSIGKTIGLRTLGRLTRSWEENIKMDLADVESKELNISSWILVSEELS